MANEKAAVSFDDIIAEGTLLVEHPLAFPY